MCFKNCLKRDLKHWVLWSNKVFLKSHFRRRLSWPLLFKISLKQGKRAKLSKPAKICNLDRTSCDSSPSLSLQILCLMLHYGKVDNLKHLLGTNILRGKKAGHSSTRKLARISSVNSMEQDQISSCQHQRSNTILSWVSNKLTEKQIFRVCNS